jgi:hypothetical protein
MMSKETVINAIEDAECDAFKPFEEFINKDLCIKLAMHDGYRFIIGESPYPNANNVIPPYPKGIYQKERIPEVAFLSSDWTIDVILICGILFGSIDKATKFLDWIIPKGKNTISLFGEFLYQKCNILIINRYDRTKNGYKNRDKLIANLIKKFNPTRILVVGKRTTKTFNKTVQHVATSIIHPTGANAYFYPFDWLNAYFLDSKALSGGSQSKDFKI